MGARRLYKDEDGVVMVEFIVVFPFLAILMFLILYYMEATRFQMSAMQLAQTQTWRAAALEQTAGMARSDDFGFAGSTSYAASSTMHPRNPIMIREFKHSGHDYITQLSDGAGIADVLAILLVPPNKAVWELLSINPSTFNRNALNLDTVGLGGELRYRNQNFTRPVAAFSSTFVGKSSKVDNTGLAMSDLEFSVAPAIPMIHDPFSIFWGKNEPYGGKIQRLRNVDRYTIKRAPPFSLALAGHGLMTVNLRSLSHFSQDQLLRDLYGDVMDISPPTTGMGGVLDEIFKIFKPDETDPQGEDSARAASLRRGRLGSFAKDILDKALSSLGGGSKHAQPLWKVDKNADTQDHDVNGKVTYGGTEWGDKITERHRLNETQSSDDRWRMIQ